MDFRRDDEISSEIGSMFLEPNMLDPTLMVNGEWDEGFGQAGAWSNTQYATYPPPSNPQGDMAMSAGGLLDTTYMWTAGHLEQFQPGLQSSQSFGMPSGAAPPMPYNNSYALAQSTTQPGSGLNHFSPQHQPTQPRPQLQVATSSAALRPQNQVYPHQLPRSAPPRAAPHIFIQRVDSIPREMPAPTTYSDRRPRAHSDATMPLLTHAQTEPDLPRANNLLSPSSPYTPVMDRFLQEEHAVPQGHIAQASIESPRSRSASRSSRGRHKSVSRSPTHSRESSVVSSRSSMSGEFQCQECNKRYATNSKLKHHKRYHTPYEERKNVCEECGLRFLFKRELVRHMQTITHGGRPFVCSNCTSAFPRQDHLDRHIVNKSCNDRAVTPTPSDNPSNPPSTGSSVGLQSRARAKSTGDLRQDTPCSDFGLIPQLQVFELPNHMQDNLDFDPSVDPSLYDPSLCMDTSIDWQQDPSYDDPFVYQQ
ncbi:hypothetical protein LTS14_010343 [Recurvomyces mirabilis]|uniref:uncharacterized protein n=1 Tax=Recurvomyces mirabilis TaxID=574656 RepID=UPI002DDE7663|nr:hypothetical protein LTS14_010343 [Recurvomyces mirabilis]